MRSKKKHYRKIHYVKYAKYWFSLTRIFPNKKRIVDSALIREYLGQKKPVFWNILRSDSEKCSGIFSSVIYEIFRIWREAVGNLPLSCILQRLLIGRIFNPIQDGLLRGCLQIDDGGGGGGGPPPKQKT